MLLTTHHRLNGAASIDHFTHGMATRTVQRTRVANNLTKTAITQKQSLEVVQTLLHGSLSSLAYLRSFFSEKVFDTQAYAAHERLPSYREYADGKLPDIPKGSTRPHTTMQVLRRGRSKRVDTFLDWLVIFPEQGAFLALKDGRLRALQLYVHTTEHDRGQVVETYTFRIQYHDDGKGGKFLAGVDLDSPGRKSLTVDTTAVALQTLLRYVMEMCNGLPELPDDRYVSMALFLRTETGPDFQPEGGFELNNTTKLVFGLADGWEKKLRKFDDLSSAFHTTAFTIAHLHNTTIGPLASVAEPVRIPSQLQYREDEEETDLFSEPESEEAVAADASTIVPSTVGRTPALTMPDTDQSTVHSVKKSHFSNLITPAPTSDAAAKLRSTSVRQPSFESVAQQHVTAPAASQPVDTQASNVPRMRGALRQMVIPDHLTQGDTQTQHLQDAKLLNEAASDSPHLSTHSSVPDPRSAKVILLPNVMQQLNSEKVKLQDAARKLAKISKSRAKKGDVVLCQCGIKQEQAAMVQCAYCKTWQHLHCHGYTGSNDPRLAETHACYNCLLGNGRDDTLATLKDLALKRHAMNAALSRGMTSQADFVVATGKKPQTGRLALRSLLAGLSLDTATLLHDYLRQEGFITPASRPVRRGAAYSSEARSIPTQEGGTYKKMLVTLFDPLKHVEQFYCETSLDLSAIGQQVRTMRAASMPPPDTPASQMRARRSATPASSLDLGQSVVPVETPYPYRSSLLKRPSEDDIFSTPAKRQAVTPVYLRFLSAQALRADGLSSIPSVSQQEL
ncbi:HORMA domain-containing protein 1 [Pseudocercospora fuligena]|uniref:HORMA domain-containing protein 1 n=1 Tax=Pseudocercospora fuligena TaxID=685502 RepID=A0A8H6RDE0_9PEZI|nr:HORMA domain-containing protein 1 [Pseudocercospora fuligena]